MLRKLLASVEPRHSAGDVSSPTDARQRERDDCAPSGSPEQSTREATEGRTTVMVHNIPTACTPEELLEVFPIDGTYDLLYAPLESCGKRLAGFAFLNLATEAHAADFMSSWHRAHRPGSSAGRRLKVVWSRFQGLAANKQHLRETGARAQRARQHGLVIVGGERRPSLDGL